LILTLALAGCTLDTPDVGLLQATSDAEPGDAGTGDGGTHLGCSNADSDPSVAVSFAHDVRPLMFRSPGGCNCHLNRTTSGLDLTTYEALRRGGLNSGAHIVIPGEPCTSILLLKLSRTPPFGSRMPFNGPPYLSATEVQVVHDWIAEGALDN
jgi:hypothetical protein